MLQGYSRKKLQAPLLMQVSKTYQEVEQSLHELGEHFHLLIMTQTEQKVQATGTV